ncbi:hypothetical protein AB834_04530 [PVC group bacterium (ex Bugula neritina AB1)]|nr:hypothetical protein AB834_04530 [PVC group bacterium (ex Bugula neritina AB1)]
MFKIALIVIFNIYSFSSIFPLGVSSEIFNLKNPLVNPKSKELSPARQSSTDLHPFPKENFDQNEYLINDLGWNIPFYSKNKRWRSFFKILGAFFVFFLISLGFFILGEFAKELAIPGKVLFVISSIALVQVLTVLLQYNMFHMLKATNKYEMVKRIFYKILPTQSLIFFFLLLSISLTLFFLEGIKSNYFYFFTSLFLFLFINIFVTDFIFYRYLKKRELTQEQVEYDFGCTHKFGNLKSSLKMSSYNFKDSNDGQGVQADKDVPDAAQKNAQNKSRNLKTKVSLIPTTKYKLYLDWEKNWRDFSLADALKLKEFSKANKDLLSDNIFTIVSLMYLFDQGRFGKEALATGKITKKSKQEIFIKNLRVFVKKEYNLKYFFEYLFIQKYPKIRLPYWIERRNQWIKDVISQIENNPVKTINLFKKQLKDMSKRIHDETNNAWKAFFTQYFSLDKFDSSERERYGLLQKKDKPFIKRGQDLMKEASLYPTRDSNEIRTEINKKWEKSFFKQGSSQNNKVMFKDKKEGISRELYDMLFKPDSECTFLDVLFILSAMGIPQIDSSKELEKGRFLESGGERKVYVEKFLIMMDNFKNKFSTKNYNIRNIFKLTLEQYNQNLLTYMPDYSNFDISSQWNNLYIEHLSGLLLNTTRNSDLNLPFTRLVKYLRDIYFFYLSDPSDSRVKEEKEGCVKYNAWLLEQKSFSSFLRSKTGYLYLIQERVNAFEQFTTSA